MNANEVRELSTDELHGRVGELKEEMFNLRFQLATGQLDNHRRMRQVRRDVARIRTVLRERDYAAAEGTKQPVAALVEAHPVEAREAEPAPDMGAEEATP
jgi:large subunit ribosomal protein L29